MFITLIAFTVVLMIGAMLGAIIGYATAEAKGRQLVQASDVRTVLYHEIASGRFDGEIEKIIRRNNDRKGQS